jgi:flagellar biosynthesis component FlhA
MNLLELQLTQQPPDIYILTTSLFQLRALIFSVPHLLLRTFTYIYISVAYKINRNADTTQHRTINYFPLYFIKRFSVYNKFHVEVIS